ncbi:MAG: hypothetical protein L3J96_04805 [Thermoplasmata archaeon]|nr:hypothetical protein [Thermoplasmata archaeon]
MVSKPPALYRLSRLLRRVSIVVLVLIIVYLASSVYSASKLNPGNITKANSRTSILPNGTVQLVTAVNLTNPGYYPINSFSLSVRVEMPAGALLAWGSSPPASVAPASTASIPIIVNFPVNFNGAQQTLLTHDVQLPTHFWVNVTFASLLTAALSIGSNISWKAPFFGFNATVGTPEPNANGTATIPVTITFDNHAQFGATGNLTFTVRSAGGATCGSGSAPVDDHAGVHFDQTVNVVGAGSCDPRGGTLTGRFTGDPWSFSLPSESIP